MNNRDYKQFAPNQYYHVFNRGVGKMDIFRDEQDWKFFLFRLKEILFPSTPTMGTIVKPKNGYIPKSLPAGAFSLVAYCLMPNHFHFLVRQNQITPVSKMISKLCTSYSKYFNQKYERVGSVFQGAFKAIVVENDAYLLWLSAYIHNNPRTAGLVERSETWLWGSYMDYLGLRGGKLCNKDSILGQLKNSFEYKNFVDDSFEKIWQKKELEDYFLE
jgi:putative transposase